MNNDKNGVIITFVSWIIRLISRIIITFIRLITEMMTQIYLFFHKTQIKGKIKQIEADVILNFPDREK